ncbi:hypothetical protein PQG02_35750 (plasmid) [Nostoc sp. UHCC 0926]|uniref:hypothetical protein n=1 Tax=Nostoc sp. UHCC 0926 TaxID=3025190 RepID=UPI002362960A|nr:hypothetical protein [Nostoc sp. UHCC 0926]WDD36504.1 hypothetical protein PQG02_35750 [Nostoc sp. UHCC 0926]
MNDFSFTVRFWHGKHTVGLQHLKSYNYLPAECEQMQVICVRISRLQENENLEDACCLCCAEVLGGTEATVFDSSGGEAVGFD